MRPLTFSQEQVAPDDDPAEVPATKDDGDLLWRDRNVPARACA